MPSTGEETLVCKETALGRSGASGAPGARKTTDDGVLRFPETSDYGEKTARGLEHEKDVILHMEGYRTGPERTNRDVHLVRNEQAVNIDMLLVGEFARF